MGLFMLAAVASAPFFVGALASSATARLNLQAKAVGQERIERMRNLPFHVGRQNGAYIDLLDTYFRDVNTTATGAANANDVCSSRIYLAASKTYECTISNLGTGVNGFSQLVRAQFLTSSRSVVTPPVGYTTQTAGADAPPSNLLFVEVITRWSDQGRAKSFPVRTQIANEGEDIAYLRASVESTGLRVQGNLSGGDVLEMRAGLVTADATLTTGSRVALGTAPARVSRASGGTLTGALLSLTAPPDTAGTSPTGAEGRLGGNCDLACFGTSAVSGDQTLSISNGLPRASLAANPATGALNRISGVPGDPGLVYSNVQPSLVDTLLGLTGPIISAVGGSATVARSTGYLDGTGGGSTAVRSSSTVSVPRVAISPTGFAPAGVVQLELTSASMTCTSGAGSASVSTAWSGKVRWMTPAGNYNEVELKPGGAGLPNPATTLVRAGEPLSKYVSAWSATTSAASADTSSGRTARGDLANVVTVLTTNTRAGDDTSPITISLGALSCLAEDNR